MPGVRVAFQGEPGAYSDAAARDHFGRGVVTLPHHSFDDVFEAVSAGEVDFGFVPIENALAGSIHRNYDLMQRHDLHIVGEKIFRVRHCLMALPGTRLADVRLVRSHPQALAQCEGFLDAHGLAREAAYDTAGAAKQLAASGLPDQAAIASAFAAEVYGLAVLAEGVEDVRENFTRFLVLACAPVHPTGEAKTALMCTLPHRPGALFRALGVFALRDVDMTKIESRPVLRRSWEYMFYIDVKGSLDDLPVARAIEHLREMAPELRVLGSFNRDADWRETAGSGGGGL